MKKAGRGRVSRQQGEETKKRKKRRLSCSSKRRRKKKKKRSRGMRRKRRRGDNLGEKVDLYLGKERRARGGGATDVHERVRLQGLPHRIYGETLKEIYIILE